MATHRQAATGRVDFSREFADSQFVVGNYNTVNRYYGTVVQHLPASARPTPRPAPRPQERLPRPRPPLLGRDAELDAAQRTLVEGAPVEFHGPTGVGKSALLAHLATSLEHTTAGAPDGIIHARVGGHAADDILQWLFGVFFTTDVAWTPGVLRAADHLRGVRALIVLDDVTLDHDEVATLLDAMPNSAFLLGSPEPRLDAPAHTSPLGALPAESARALFERSLGHPLQPGEDAPAAAFLLAVDRIPGAVVEGARAVRDGICPLSDLAFNVGGELPRRRLEALSDAQRRLLAFLAELAPAAAGPDLLAAAGAGGAADLQALEAAGLATRDASGFALDVSLPARVRAAPHDASPKPLLATLAGTARRSPDAIVAQAAAAVAALAWGRRTGAHEAVVDAARAIEPALEAGGRPGARAQALEHGRAAAEQTGRTADLAHFLHQQGTWELCLGDPRRAERRLAEAIELRKRLGDTMGAAASQHNLDVLHSGEPVRAAPGAAADRGRWGLHPRASTSLLVVGALAVGVAAGALLARDDGGDAPQMTAPGGVVTGSGGDVTVVLPPRTVTVTVTVPRR